MKSIPKLCRIVGFFTLSNIFLGIIIYILAGIISVPSASPLADPNYVIRPLNDVNVPYGTVLTSEEMAAMPVNQLGGGNNWAGTLLLYVVIYAAVTLFFVRSHEGDKVSSTVISWLTVALIAFKGMAETLAEIPFCYGSLRSGAQSLIDNSRHLRTIIAWIKLWCDQQNLTARKTADILMVIFFIVSLVITAAAEYFYCCRNTAGAATTTTYSRP